MLAGHVLNSTVAVSTSFIVKGGNITSSHEALFFLRGAGGGGGTYLPFYLTTNLSLNDNIFKHTGIKERP